MRLEELERELRAERPEPELDFARRLDEWAEAGFPRDRGLGPGNAARAGALRRIWDRISSTPPRRMLVPAGAVATAVVIAGRRGLERRSDRLGLRRRLGLDELVERRVRDARPRGRGRRLGGAARGPERPRRAVGRGGGGVQPRASSGG